MESRFNETVYVVAEGLEIVKMSYREYLEDYWNDETTTPEGIANRTQVRAIILDSDGDLAAKSKYANELSPDCYTEDEEVDNVLDQAEQLIFQISKKKIDQSFSQIKDELSLAFERIDTLQKGGGKLRGVTTGFKCLDNMLSGLQKSDMVVLGARPSMGKTSLGLDIARGAAMRGYGVGVFSLEMSKDQLVDRLIAAESTVNL